MAEESGDLRGIGPQHPQALNAQIGNAEMAPARVQWRGVGWGGVGVRNRPNKAVNDAYLLRRLTRTSLASKPPQQTVPWRAGFMPNVP